MYIDDRKLNFFSCIKNSRYKRFLLAKQYLIRFLRQKISIFIVPYLRHIAPISFNDNLNSNDIVCERPHKSRLSVTDQHYYNYLSLKGNKLWGKGGDSPS